MASYLLPLLPPDKGDKMYARDIEELHEAANSLEQSIRHHKDEIAKYGPELDPYMIRNGQDQYLLAPLLAAQIIISNQLDKLVAEHDTTSETACDGTRRSGRSTEPL